MTSSERETITGLIKQADVLTSSANEIYKTLWTMIGQGTVQGFLIQVLYEGSDSKFKKVNDLYRKDKAKLSAKDLETFRLFSRTAVGISRAKEIDSIDSDLKLLYFMEFRISGDTTEVAEVKAVSAVADVKAALKPAEIKAAIDDIKKGKAKVADIKTTAKKPAGKRDHIVTLAQIESLVERASDELVLKALIDKAKKKGASAMAQALELILPLTMVSLPVIAKATNLDDVDFGDEW